MMKKFRTNDLRGNALRAAVEIAACLGFVEGDQQKSLDMHDIMERESINVTEGFMTWVASHPGYGPLSAATATGDTRIQAAMRCFVKLKLGDTVEIPCNNEAYS